MSYRVVNKYGKTVTLPGTNHNTGVQRIISILDEYHVPYLTEYAFDETGYRRMKFDVALMKDDKPVVLIEYDGAPHFYPDFYEDVGTRKERCPVHVVRSVINDARKTAVAAKFGVPVVRFDDSHLPYLRDRILALAEIFVEGAAFVGVNDEVFMLDMFFKYGFDVPYVPPSEMTKAEKECVEAVYASLGVDVGTMLYPIRSPEGSPFL